MSPDKHAGVGDLDQIVRLQLGRDPREPWRVAQRCTYGFPQVIASPSVLADGDRFPTTYWLTCPYLVEQAYALESQGEARRWQEELSRGGPIAEAMIEAAERFAIMRRDESGGVDACAAVSIAGQRDPLATKCLHAHVALALVGGGDPIGHAVLDVVGGSCQDMRCIDLSEG